MPRRKILLSVSTALLLAGCAASVKEAPHLVEPPLIPPLPADILACAHAPVAPPDQALDAGEVERLWKTDRARLAQLNSCLRRAVCQYQDLRAGLARVETATCRDDPPMPATGRRSGKGKGS
ncbi:hypothetical protein [Bradyrhizobium sp. SZCCHNR2032]|uniref:hypothetical protein n=1 Tax=Bradyrhizobium sp. SZCCHNR2032 TaxID=3057384 RepID=UPI0029164CCC|nr:hypothetical protein [Bradyrhizobium sp. SZCCHNR2032]